MSLIFPTLDDLLLARGVRQRQDGSFAEDSYDYGVWWRDPRGGVHRLSWIGGRMRDDESQAGELYLVRLSGPHVGVVSIGEVEASATLDLSASAYYARLASAGGEVGPVELLCVVPPDPDRPSERIDAILGGWAEICGLPNSTLWVRDRVGEALEARWATLPTLVPAVAEDARVVGEPR